jgi:hypothetical protein
MSRPGILIAGLIAGLAVACGRQSTQPMSPSAGNRVAGDAAADGSTLKSTAPGTTDPINDRQLTDTPTLTASAASMRFGPQLPLQYRFQVFAPNGATVQDSGPISALSFRVTASMAFKTRHTWRVRAEYQGEAGPWSGAASFISSEGGFIRGNQLFDPLFNGVTVGELIGPVTFVPNQGARLETITSYIRYRLPQTLTAGEFSMEVEGLRANAPGDKTKVFSMGSDSPDFITDPYRVDIQYRGTSGFPPNSVQFRVLYGSATKLSLRYEPDTAIRLASVINFAPTQTSFWTFTWGNGEVRLVIRNGGSKDNGAVLYNQGVPTPNGSYDPQPHMIYLGAPTGRSGAESASIPGTIYRNVYVGPSPRPF